MKDYNMIEIRGLSKSYGKLKVLKKIDLDVKASEVVVIIGASGSGKSGVCPEAACMLVIAAASSASARTNETTRCRPCMASPPHWIAGA